MSAHASVTELAISVFTNKQENNMPYVVALNMATYQVGFFLILFIVLFLILLDNRSFHGPLSFIMTQISKLTFIYLTTHSMHFMSGQKYLLISDLNGPSAGYFSHWSMAALVLVRITVSQKP